VFTPKALAQYERVLCPDGHDQAEAQDEPLGEDLDEPPRV
jgi:hypothetical protein